MKQQSISEISKDAKIASRFLSAAAGNQKQKALALMPEKLDDLKAELFSANTKDVKEAEENGLAKPLLKRLKIDEKVFSYMKKRLIEAAGLPDPVGRILDGFTNPDGLNIRKVSVPIGVIGIIYESRPNVTSDAAAVCLKSGNAVILRGGSESLRTNRIIVNAMRYAIKESGLPENCVQLVDGGGHEAVGELLKESDNINLIIPRGGKNLIKRISAESRIPVLKHYDGICHQYIAADADPEKSVKLVKNSKTQKVEVCNSLESILINEKALHIIPVLKKMLLEEKIEIRGCPKICALISSAIPAEKEDWSTEYLNYIISIKVVEDTESAVGHINKYGSGHTDGIITESRDDADYFAKHVDSASVMINASTRLSGGGDYGMGAVIGISTDKLHARGPVGPNELTSYKWIAEGKCSLRN